MAISIDWMPTIAQYCGLKPPEHKIDGRSIVRVIESQNAPSPHKVLHWETSRGKHWAVREGDWKLVHNGPATDYKGRKLPKAENFLSNIAEDATETKNLAKSNPNIVKHLTNLHEQWVRQI
jgi:arylsulfatase A-like enzyme